MTTEQICEPLTAAELQGFATKLQDLWGQLSAKERAFFGRLIAPAAEQQGEDVEGYGYVEYGQSSLGFIWMVIQNTPNPFVPQPVPAPTPVPAASSGTTAGSYNGPSSTTRLN
ncbi:MAG TPA: hypothetical protein VKV26_14465 [Dehalococcoidia bacterium]|nr:hypothetical protein [Dehalococcoidia bacterium]